MSKNRQKPKTNNQKLLAFYRESKKTFGNRYEATGKQHILIAQYKLEHAVEQGNISFATAKKSLRDSVIFEQMLAKEEKLYKNKEDKEIFGRLSILEKATNWKPVALISFVVGTIFLVVSPFSNSLLQPTADELLKRKSKGNSEPRIQFFILDNSITNHFSDTYNITNDNDGNIVLKPKPEAPAKKGKTLSSPQLQIK